jgi:phosphatidylglycerophosphate synthase
MWSVYEAFFNRKQQVSDAISHTRVAESEAPWTFEAALKDATVEETVNLVLHRRLAFWMIRPLQGRFAALSPNHITLFSGVLGIGAGVSAYSAVEYGPMWLALGAVLLMLSAVVDCADGMLARLRGQSSEFGMLLDGCVDQITGISAWYGICYAVCAGIELPGEWLYCIFPLLSAVVHVALYDQIKAKFVAYTTPCVSNAPAKAPASGFERWASALYHTVYGSIMRIFGGGRAAVPTCKDPAAARRLLTPAMRKASYLGLGTQLFVFYTGALLGAFTHVWATFFFCQIILSVLSNIWIAVAIISWKRAEARLLAELKGA